jgi:hypothetical protein
MVANIAFWRQLKAKGLGKGKKQSDEYPRALERLRSQVPGPSQVNEVRRAGNRKVGGKCDLEATLGCFLCLVLCTATSSSSQQKIEAV